ncbi:hypothetical protein JCM14469_37330 [Desulfatiferula olefinivorans]
MALRCFVSIPVGIVFFLAAFPPTLFATQAHGEPEGIVVHQMGHLFFMVAMAVFAYWLRQRRTLTRGGWRYIMLFALLLVIWNANVMLLHYLDEQSGLILAVKDGFWHITIDSLNGSDVLSVLYYLGKMDHLLGVPALVFLYLGLRRLLVTVESQTSGERR